MTRIAIVDRADMNADQARVYDAAKQSGGPVGGPYYAYIRLPKLFEAAQGMRACLASGPLSRREQQIVNLVIARHWGARYPWFAQVRGALAAGIDQPAIDAINARKTPQLSRCAGADVLHRGERVARQQAAQQRDLCGRRGRSGSCRTSSRWSRPPAASRPPA